MYGRRSKFSRGYMGCNVATPGWMCQQLALPGVSDDRIQTYRSGVQYYYIILLLYCSSTRMMTGSWYRHCEAQSWSTQNWLGCVRRTHSPDVGLVGYKVSDR